jgi:peptidoglycan/LPS O-acetylase OafA/YrhL
MLSYLYIGVIIFFVIALLVVAKVMDNEDMRHNEEDE